MVPSHLLNHSPSRSPIDILRPSGTSCISPCDSGTSTHLLSAYALPPTAQRPPPRGWRRWNNHIQGYISVMMSIHFSHGIDMALERGVLGRTITDLCPDSNVTST